MIYEFMATQSYNGYEKPWAGGSNINLLPPGEEDSLSAVGYTVKNENGIYTFNGTTSNAGSVKFTTAELYDVTSGQKMFLFNTAQLSSIRVALFKDTTEVTYWALNALNRIVTSAVTETDLTAIRFTVGTTGFNTDGLVISPMLCASDTPNSTPFSPWQNVCMPEGFNIWDPDTAEYFQVYAGYVNTNTRELYLRPVYDEYAGEELVGPWMSSLDEYDEDTTPTEGAFVIDFGGELTSFEITPFMLQTLLDSLGIRQHFTDGAGLLNKLMDQAQGRVRSEEELLHLSRPLNVIAIGDQLPAGLTFKPISKDVLPGLPGKFIR